jgi:hypothetical protein
MDHNTDHKMPLPALILGFGGLIPFIWGTACLYNPELNAFSVEMFGPRMSSPFIQLSYGTIIICFISGILWGFSATVEDAKLRTYGLILSSIPTIWVFFMVGGGPVQSAINLIVGFIAVLALDFYYNYLGLNPKWWIRLRVILTVFVVIFLGIIAFA